MARILILTNGHLCRNPRALKEANTLGQAGHDTTVIGVRNHRRSDTEDRKLMMTASFKNQSLNFLPGSGPMTLVLRFTTRLRIARAMATGQADIGVLGPARWLLNAAAKHAADLTICHNEIAHWAGIQLQARGRAVAADIEDWHSEDLLPADRRSRPIGLLRQIEQVLVTQFHYATTTSTAMASGLNRRYGGRSPEVVANAFPLQPDPLVGRRQDRRIRFFWFSQTLGPGRGLEGFLPLWAKLDLPTDLVLLGEDRQGFKEHLLKLVPLDVRPRLHFRPLVSPEALPAVIAEHDIGLALEDGSIVSRDLTITNKILQYLNAGLAVAATPTAGQREVLAHLPTVGEFFDPQSPPAASAALRRLVEDRIKLHARQLAARSLAAQRYCWEHEAPRLCHLVADALERKSSACA